MQRWQMLTDEQTFDYIRAAKAGDLRAKEALLEQNTSLLKSIVRRYLGKGVEFDELVYRKFTLFKELDEFRNEYLGICAALGYTHKGYRRVHEHGLKSYRYSSFAGNAYKAAFAKTGEALERLKCERGDAGALN